MTSQFLKQIPGCFILACFGLLASLSPEAYGQSDAKLDPVAKVKDLFSGFEKLWDETKWQGPFRGVPHMRVPQDVDWFARMDFLSAVAACGADAIPFLESCMESDNTPSRILAAQAFGYVASDADIEKLKGFFRKEKDAAARLYLVDAIGMSGKGETVDWKELAGQEKNRDVLKHIKYAKERGGSAVEQDVVDQLAGWKTATRDFLKVGDQAPEMKLSSVDGIEYSLSQFRGKKPVVLVFVYGDT